MLKRLKDSESCTCCLSVEERQQTERSKEIDRELTVYKRRYRATQKIVLLGAGESGKSTFLKQMQIIHGNGFTDDEKIMYRTQIYENMLRGMAGLVNGKKELRLPWRGSFSNLRRISDLNDADDAHAADIAVVMKGVVSAFVTAYRSLMDEREKEAVKLGRRVDILPQHFRQTRALDLIRQLWNEHSIREAYDRRREFPKYFVENIPYFISNLDRIGNINYIPTLADILRARRATSTINEMEMEIKSVPFRFVDVGGQRTQRQKWHQCFSDVTAILFLASSSEFDEYLREDATTNRLDEACKVFETLINYKYLRTVEFILFLNKHDLLKEKITKVDIKTYCGDFRGDSSSLKDVENYLVQKFSNLRHAPASATTKQTAQSNNFHSIQSNADTSSTSLSRGERAIYTHFTTAIDTNNIQTIFEMVRLMIFENNCKAIMLN